MKVYNDGNDNYLVEYNDITQLLLASESAHRRKHQSADLSNEGINIYTDQQLIGQKISILMLDRFQSAHGSYISNYLKTKRSKF